MGRISTLYRSFADRGPRTPLELLVYLGLIPLSWMYGIIGLARSWSYRMGFLHSYRAPGLVISVGNLAVGGTGKTPMVEYVARHYQIGRAHV